MIHFVVKNFEFAHTKNEKGESYYCATHCHNTYEIYLLLKGNVEYIVGNSRYFLRPFDLLLIPPSVFHCPCSQHGEYERVIFNFNKTDLNINVQTLLENIGSHYQLRNNVFIRSITLDFLPLTTAVKADLKLRMVTDLLELILIQLSAAQPAAEQKIIHPTLSAIIDYIDDNLDKKLHLKDISKNFFVSPSWINYAFKKYYNINYSQYTKTKKMTYAQSLLQAGETPKSTAVTCGFEVYTTFLRQYKEFFGRLPSEDILNDIKT